MHYPWHHTQWQVIDKALATARLPHAILLFGHPHLAKFAFAEQLSQRLLCDQLSACGKCRQCQLVMAGTHPDLRLVLPDNGAKTIGIDKIRCLQSGLYQSKHSANYQVVILRLAEQLTVAASNALLKILEEPPNNTIFLLVSESIEQLLPTIRSRSQCLYFKPATTKEMQQFSETCHLLPSQLALLEGAPMLAAARLSPEAQATQMAIIEHFVASIYQPDTIIAAAAFFNTKAVEMVLDVMIQFTQRCLKTSVGFSSCEPASKELAALVTKFNNKTAKTSRFDVLKCLYIAKKKWLGNNNLNQLLFLEDSLLQCARELNGTAGH